MAHAVVEDPPLNAIEKFSVPDSDTTAEPYDMYKALLAEFSPSSVAFVFVAVKVTTSPTSRTIVAYNTAHGSLGLVTLPTNGVPLRSVSESKGVKELRLINS